jgi:hypothetical protein
MNAPSRSRRRHDYYRMRGRALHRSLYPSHTDRSMSVAAPDVRVLGKMVSTRGPVHTCRDCCGNRRKYDGPSLAERRLESWLDEWAQCGLAEKPGAST